MWETKRCWLEKSLRKELTWSAGWAHSLFCLWCGGNAANKYTALWPTRISVVTSHLGLIPLTASIAVSSLARCQRVTVQRIPRVAADALPSVCPLRERALSWPIRHQIQNGMHQRSQIVPPLCFALAPDKPILTWVRGQ